MDVVFCNDKKVWDEQFSDEFLQSWQWGEFQKKVGNKAVRILIKDGSKVFSQFQGLEYGKFGLVKFLYIPKVDMSGFDDEVSKKLFDFLKSKGYMFVRIEPVNEIGRMDGFESIKIKNRQPKNTFVLDVTNDVDTLKSKMHSKTRYNIGLSERKGVRVESKKNIDVFWKLNEQTVNRDNFKSHGKEYYKKMLEMDICYQLTAYKDDTPLSSNICINFDGVFTYLHGASSNEFRNLMAPYLLQWECIKFAKGLGAREYDLGGTAPVYLENQKHNIKTATCFNGFCWDVTHKWTGITRFKVGFGGTPKNYPDATEVILKKKMYNIFNKMKSVL